MKSLEHIIREIREGKSEKGDKKTLEGSIRKVIKGEAESSYAAKDSKPVEEAVGTIGTDKYQGNEFKSIRTATPHIKPPAGEGSHSQAPENVSRQRSIAKEKLGINRVEEEQIQEGPPLMPKFQMMPKIPAQKPSLPFKEPPPKIELPPLAPAEKPVTAPPKPQPKVETPKAEPKVEPKVETPAKVEPKVETPAKVEPKVETPAKIDAKTEVKPETPAKIESKPGNKTGLTPADKTPTGVETPGEPTGKPKFNMGLSGSHDSALDVLMRVPVKTQVHRAKSHSKHHVKEDTETRKQIENMPRKGDRKSIEYVGRKDADPKTAREKTSRLATIKNVIDEAKKELAVKKQTSFEDGKTKVFDYGKDILVISPDQRKVDLDVDNGEKIAKDYGK